MLINFFPYWQSPRRIRVRSGSTVRTEGNVHHIRKSVVHPRYNPFATVSSNDIALLFVEEHFVFSESVQPVLLPIREPPPDTDTTVSGWGHRSVSFINFEFKSARKTRSFFRYILDGTLKSYDTFI